MGKSSKTPRRRRSRPAIEGTRTVIYVHGIGNKPTASVLKSRWDHALFGADMGDRTRMAYWVDRNRYPFPSNETGQGPSARSYEPIVVDDANVESNDVSDYERGVMDSLAARMSEFDPGATEETDAFRAKVLPLPPRARRWVTRELTRRFLRDVRDLLFDEAARERMISIVTERLSRAGDGPFVVIGHSQGSIIAYEALRRLGEGCQVAAFLTMGSPLGLAEVQDVLKQWAGTRGKLPIPKGVAHWFNVSDKLDPVCLDGKLRNDFKPARVVDHDQWWLNTEGPGSPHSATGYLASEPVQELLRATVGGSFAQQVTDFVLARDLVGRIEDAPRVRHEVLIELSNPENDGSLDEARKTLIRSIREVSDGAAQIEPLRRYLSASLTRSELERLRATHKHLNVHKVWRDAEKRALIDETAQRMHCAPARSGFGASGEGIHWAVLDTGIHKAHPHFRTHDSVADSWDCTQYGSPTRGGEDANGHGTHVAGIIAGESTTSGGAFAGMAPEAKLHTYKVLRDNGSGRDSYIIKALDHIAETNEQAGRLVIHGVNLSLGGPFDPNVYGCGHSPLCQELRRLWRQGVVVVLAAGNEGYAVLESRTGPIDATLDLSIGDPANLEDAIAVGAVHRTKPHLYGVSYFSSRGPTADGRYKPDVVAPGEKILSASHKAPARSADAEKLYVPMSGTSMAAPHVSGLIAGFLSVRQEFIGYPDRIKALLLENCTDLGRDRYIQGFGLPNLVKMITNT